MVIQDSNVDEYIAMDMTELDIYDKEIIKSQNLIVQLAIQDKLDFRYALAQSVSVTRLNYMLRVIRTVRSKATISDPDAFKYKIRSMQKRERTLGLRRLNSSSSFRSLFSKSARSSGKSSSNGSNSDNDHMAIGDEDQDEDAQVDTIKRNPLLTGINDMFDKINDQIEINSIDRLKNLNAAHETKLKLNKAAAEKKQADIMTGLEDLMDDTISHQFTMN